MTPQTTQTVQVAALVPAELATALRELAQKAERSQAAEVRLALRAWVDSASAAGERVAS